MLAITPRRHPILTGDHRTLTLGHLHHLPAMIYYPLDMEVEIKHHLTHMPNKKSTAVPNLVVMEAHSIAVHDIAVHDMEDLRLEAGSYFIQPPCQANLFLQSVYGCRVSIPPTCTHQLCHCAQK